MVSINTNISSLVAQSSLRNSTSKLNNAIEQMTTGYKINHAKDNAANYSIAVDMSTKIGAYDVAEDNCAMALDLVNTANDAYDLIADKLERVIALQNQYQNGTYGKDTKNAMADEAFAIIQEILRIKENTKYNGMELFDNQCLDLDSISSITFNFQIGINDSNSSKITIATSEDYIDFFINASPYIGEQMFLGDFYVEDIKCNYSSILSHVTAKQTELGAVQNRLESALESISVQRDNLISSRSTIKDTDVAEVSSEYIKQQILQQASATLLATANQSPAIALQLI